MELLVTDEVMLSKICNLWLIHNEGETVRYHNEDRLNTKPKEIMEHKPNGNKEDSDDIVLMGNDDDLELVEVKKSDIEDKVEKKMKYN